MKHLRWSSVLLFWCVASLPHSVAQSATPPQDDVKQLAAALYATHLDDGSWTRYDAEPCARLPRHRFALFTQTPTNGAVARFFAVYNLDATQIHGAKPWQRGVQLIRLRARPEKSLGFGPSDTRLLTVFNHVLEQEHAAGPGVTPAARINIDDLADCFLAATGEHRAPIILPPSLQALALSRVPIAGGPVTGIMVPLISPPDYTLTENIRVDEQGLLTKADIQAQYTAR